MTELEALEKMARELTESVASRTWAAVLPFEREAWRKMQYFAHCARHGVEAAPWEQVKQSWMEVAGKRHQAARSRWRRENRP